MSLDPNRIFDPDPAIRNIAGELYRQVKDLPLISPHGHVNPRLLAENQPFPDPAELIIIPDHYIFRLLYSQGIALEALGVPTLDGSPVESDHRKIWQIFADNFYLFAGTPTGIWVSQELEEVFGITEKLDGRNATAIYDTIQTKLGTPEFLPRALFEQFNLEVLTTTEAASDTLQYHRQIRESDWTGRVVPCFRPDTAIDIASPSWKKEIGALGELAGAEITTYQKFIRVLEERRAAFKAMGATSTDQGIESPYTQRLSTQEASAIFQRALTGQADQKDARSFIAHMLMEMARMSTEDGLVMQLHPGSLRNHNRTIFEKFGLDKGCDIPVQTEYTRNLAELLNQYGNDPRLTLVVFTLDETAYSRELAPLAGHYPAMRLGASWWFNDSLQGMMRFREMVTETASVYNTVGFTDDTRAFPSIPARHDLSRRIDANFLAGLVARHVIDLEDASRMIRALAYDLPKKTYKLDLAQNE